MLIISGTVKGKHNPTIFIACWDLFSMAPDGAQMQNKWRNTNLNVCMYWPDF